ncbi:MAG: hypothetical protein II254_03220 [Oscillospiraceae bacterium]|nr:hypothetical protein [Oscillospiraceae bacterium]
MKTRVISALVGLLLLGAVLCLFETAVLDVAIAALSVMAVYEMINAVGLSKNKTFTAVSALFGAFSQLRFSRQWVPLQVSLNLFSE